MFISMNRKTSQRSYRIILFSPTICLLTAFITLAAGCASAPLYRAHAELPARNGAIRTVGLMPPDIKMFEEQVALGFKFVLHDDWSREAAGNVRQAFIDETAAAHLPFTLIGGDDRELNDMADLYSAVDFQIRIFYPLPEKARAFDYTLGPARETMEQHGVDAVWIITGFDLLPTPGKQIMDAVEIFLAILTIPAGGGQGPVKIRPEIRAALVDKTGTILFYCRLIESDVPQAGQNAEPVDPLSVVTGERKPGAEEELKGLRSPKTARSFVKTLFEEYQKAVAK